MMKSRAEPQSRRGKIWSPVIVSLCILLAACFSGKREELSFDSLHRDIVAGKRVVFLGDSITNHGGYYRVLDYYYQKNYPDSGINIIGVGLGSETASGLSENDHPYPRPCVHERLDRVLDILNPDIVFACYGMNDAIYHPFDEERFMTYQKGIADLIAKVRESGASVVLLTPPPFDPQSKKNPKKLQKEGADDYGFKTPYYKYNDVLATYGEWISKLNATDVYAMDIHTPFQLYTEQKRAEDPRFTLSGDGVHPNALGHFVIGKAIYDKLSAFGMSLDYQESFTAVESDPLFALVSRRSKPLSKALLEYIGYTRGTVVKTDSVDQALADAARLQKEINGLRR